MIISEPAPKSHKKLLIITSSGGGGLLQAANAKEQEALAVNPELLIVRRDVLRDWVGDTFGKFCIGYWNVAQRGGYIWAQIFVWRVQWIFDLISWPQVFFQTLKILFAENFDRIIDTQNLCTSAILKAIRIYNQKRAKDLRLEKVVVDLPTKKATHYFRSIKALSRKDKRYLKLTTIPPLLDEGESAEEFWQSNCGLSDRDIQYEDFYVRQSFRKYQNIPRNDKPFSIPIRFSSEEELAYILKTCRRGGIEYAVQSGQVVFTVQPQDRVFTILLGSQPASQATFNYVKEAIQMAQDLSAKMTQKVHLFVFCADHRPGKTSLFSKVADYVDQMQDYPAALSIVPFSFQRDDVIAPLFYRSDLSCTRSGGQTAMELMAVSSGEMWVHSEARNEKRALTERELLQGIPAWEAANAVYLQKIRGAKIVTPETFAAHAKKVLKLSIL